MQIKKLENNQYTWINIYNPSDADIPKIAEQFELDNFLLQDSLEPGHLPKIEQRDSYVFLYFGLIRPLRR